MSIKSLGVRLFATGGEQVRAEFQGITTSGERALGGLSNEVERANQRLASFARRAQIAATAAAGAAIAAGVAAVRSGLQQVDAQAKLARSLDTTVESVQVLERAGQLAGVSMGQVEQASVQMTRRLSQAAGGTGPAVDALRRLRLEATDLISLPLDQRIARIQDAIAQFVPEAERAAVASQIFGDRAALMFTRIDVETLRTATQDVQDFRVAVSEVDARQIERTNDALSRLGMIWRGISNQLAVQAAPALERVADSFAALARESGPLGRAITLVFDNLGRLVAMAGTVAAFFAGRFVASFVAAAAAVVRLTGALTALRTLMARTLPGVLVLGLGEIVARMTGLVGASADAERAIDNLTIALGDEHRALSALAPALTAGTRLSLEQARAKLEEVRTRRQNIVAIIEETRALAMQTGEFRAAQREVDDIMMRVRALQNTGRDGGRFAPQANRADIEFLMGQLQDVARRRGEILGPGPEQARALAEADAQIRRITEAIENATGGIVTMGEDLVPVVELTDRLAGGFTRAGGAARQAGEAVTEAAEQAVVGWDAVLRRVEDYATSAMDLGRQIGDGINRAFQSAESAVADFVRTGKLSVSDLVRSIIADFAQIGARRFIFGPLANALSGVLGGLGGGAPLNAMGAGPLRSFDGGGHTGWGARSGGLDGMGGRLAMVHPGERITDESRAGRRGEPGPVYVTIQARDVESFRQSRSQVAADIARAVAMGRRAL